MRSLDTAQHHAARVHEVLQLQGQQHDIHQTAVYLTHLSPECLWRESMEHAERLYNGLIRAGETPQNARAVLPHSLKTELVVTMNIRELRHFLALRTGYTAHPEIRRLAIPLLSYLTTYAPALFGDLYNEMNVKNEFSPQGFIITTDDNF